MAATPDDMKRALEELAKATRDLEKAQKERSRVELAHGPSLANPANAGWYEKRNAREQAASAKAAVSEARKHLKELEKDNKSDRVSDLTAAFRLAKGGAGQVAGGDALGGLGSLMGAGRAASAVGGAAGALGPVAAVLGVYVGAAYAANEFRKALDAATISTINHYKQLGEVSGAMASVMASRDVREMLREREKGDRLAGAAGALTDAEQRKEDASMELEIAWEEFKAGFLTEYQRLLGDIARLLTEMLVDTGVIAKRPRTTQSKTLGEQLSEQAREAKKDLDRHKANVR